MAGIDPHEDARENELSLQHHGGLVTNYPKREEMNFFKLGACVCMQSCNFTQGRVHFRASEGRFIGNSNAM